LFNREASVNSYAYNPPVLLTKSVLMQRCADLVRLGYHNYVVGTVAYDRSPHLARKFRDTYLVHLSKDARYRRKRAGLGNAHLLLWMHDEATRQLTFLLLVTDGEHPAHSLERLRDSRNARARIEVTGYELVRHTRVGSAKPAWTWQMTADCYQQWRSRVLRVIRTRDVLGLRQAWHSLHRLPGFARIRQQAKKIKKLMHGEWQRSGHGSFPFLNMRIPYVQRLSVIALPLSAVLARRPAVSADASMRTRQ
jgi:hypothetical protein